MAILELIYHKKCTITVSIVVTTYIDNSPQNQVYYIMTWKRPEDTAEQNLEVPTDKNG